MITANPSRTQKSRKFFLRGPFLPSHEQNRMANEGQVAQAREHFFAHRPNNLHFLLEKRYTWMNQYIASGASVLELGSGAGLSKEFIRQGKLLFMQVFVTRHQLKAQQVAKGESDLALAVCIYVIAVHLHRRAVTQHTLYHGSHFGRGGGFEL